jgi:hypothetical protein
VSVGASAVPGGSEDKMNRERGKGGGNTLGHQLQ